MFVFFWDGAAYVVPCCNSVKIDAYSLCYGKGYRVEPPIQPIQQVIFLLPLYVCDFTAAAWLRVAAVRSNAGEAKAKRSGIERLVFLPKTLSIHP